MDFFQKLDSFNRVLISTHEQPDADAIGATLGIAWYLRGLGKDTRIVVTPRLPDFLKFLDTEKWIECFDPNFHRDIAAWPDCWVLADASELSRLGPLKDNFLAAKGGKGCIDHHIIGSSMEVFDFVYSNPDASSACELVLQAINFSSGLSMDMPLAMAQALYAGLVDDTGNFRFNNTSHTVFRMAASLLEKGVKPDVVYRSLYNQGTLAKMRLFGIAFERMRLYCDERLAVTTVSLDDMKSVGAVHEDLEGLVNRPMELRTVEVSALAYEKFNGSVKLSTRSKYRVDVNAVCRLFGGGGHRLASGATLPGPITSVLEAVVPAITARIEQDIKS
ncbi:MAG: bifunctional oligoribonuclease/PAP phosphatase NrnA [Holophagales bacterium]|jgi:phosphoesterase RecJ-like protein|nr:bifunctional oligoribonuclease/PAP phosphatase NrnA [Holophagales bacterium]